MSTKTLPMSRRAGLNPVPPYRSMVPASPVFVLDLLFDVDQVLLCDVPLEVLRQDLGAPLQVLLVLLNTDNTHIRHRSRHGRHGHVTGVTDTSRTSRTRHVTSSSRHHVTDIDDGRPHTPTTDRRQCAESTNNGNHVLLHPSRIHHYCQHTIAV